MTKYKDVMEIRDNAITVARLATVQRYQPKEALAALKVAWYAEKIRRSMEEGRDDQNG